MLYTIFFDRIDKNTQYLEEIVFPACQTAVELEKLSWLLKESRKFHDYLSVVHLLEMRTINLLQTDDKTGLDILIQQMEEQLCKFEKSICRFSDEDHNV